MTGYIQFIVPISMIEVKSGIQ